MDSVAETTNSDARERLWESEKIVSDAIGRLIEFWGFKRNMGRLWTVLYLSDRPLSAREIQERLRLSSGAVSMTLSEMGRWGVVHKVWFQGSRRDYFSAEKNLWKMISHVLHERERVELSQAIEAFEQAVQALGRMDPQKNDEGRLQTQRERIQRLLEMGRLLRSVLDTILSSTSLDKSWISRLKFPGRSWLSS